MSGTIDRLFVDDVMASLLAAEDHVESLEKDVAMYRAMVSELLTALRSQNEQVTRLTWRLKHRPEGSERG